MAHQFLKSAYEFDGNYEAISEGRIKTLNVSDTYDQYGQKISASDAGDHLELLTETAVKWANDTWNEHDAEGEDYVVKFQIGDIVSAYEHGMEYNKVVTQCEEEIDYNVFKSTCQGFNYWDGNNWRTIVTSSEDDSGVTHEIEDDEEIIARLEAAIENMEFEKEGFGTRTYRYADAIVVESQFSSAWEKYSITLDNEPEEVEA